MAPPRPSRPDRGRAHGRQAQQGEGMSYNRMVAEERLIFQATEEICRILDDNETTKAELAERLGRRQSHITQILSGNWNMTLRTLAQIAHELGYEVDIRLLAMKKSGGEQTNG